MDFGFEEMLYVHRGFSLKWVFEFNFNINVGPGIYIYIYICTYFCRAYYYILLQINSTIIIHDNISVLGEINPFQEKFIIIIIIIRYVTAKNIPRIYNLYSIN